MEVMFVVLHLPTMARVAAFASYDNAVEYIASQEIADHVTGQWRDECLIEAVEEDEDLFYSINS